MSQTMKNIFSVRNMLLILAVLFICRAISMTQMPLVEPSEARYGNISSNMAVNDNFLEPQFIYKGELQNFEGKPPLYFQLAGLSCKIFGVNEFAVRFPALLSALCILLIVFFTARRLRDDETAVIAVLFCALTPVFLVFGGVCMTDLLLCLSISGAVCFYMLFSAEPEIRKKKIFSMLFFAALGVGMMVKGPVALVLAGLPIFFYTLINKRWRDLKDHAWICGSVLFLLIVVPWYWQMQCKNSEFLEYFFINENFKRFLFKEYGDRYGGGRETFHGIAVLFFIACNLPFLFCAALPFLGKKSVTRAAFKEKCREYLRDPMIGLALLAVITNTLFWSLTSRVLITYLLPTIPAMMLIAAEIMKKSGVLQSEKWQKAIRATILILVSLFCLFMIAISVYTPPMHVMGGHYFREIAQIPEYSSCRIYFLKRTPLIAEFYLRDRVVHHDSEPRKKGVEASRDCLLIADEDQIKKLKTPLNRKKISSFGSWHVYAPEQR